MANNCGQVNIPTVDNSQDECDYIISSKCVIVNRRSTFIRNMPGHDLDEYLQLLDDKINKMQNQIKVLTNIVEILQSVGQPSGIGLFDED